jgi:hypothetical protein
VGRFRLGGGAFAICAALTLLAACARPTHDRTRLEAIEAESLALMRSWPTRTYADVPKGRWPNAIARLHPEFVIVSPQGVDIVIKPYFDGGWGYFVPPAGQAPPGPAGRYSALGQGVYWYRPY